MKECDFGELIQYNLTEIILTPEVKDATINSTS
jgi:hypothetical protein